MQMSGKITLSLPSLVIVFDPKLMVLNGVVFCVKTAYGHELASIAQFL